MRVQRMIIQRLREAWTSPIDAGIFTFLQNLEVPWKDQNIDSLLNMQYHLNRSGWKIISPLIEDYTDNIDELTNAEKTQVASVIFSIYSDKWEKLYELLSLEYDPISNYDMTETEEIEGENSQTTHHTGTETVRGTGTDTHTNTGTQQNADTGTETTTHTGTRGVVGEEHVSSGSTGSIENSVYGFNSTSAVDDSASENTIEANSDTGTESTTTDNLTDTRTDALTHTRTDNLTDTETRNLTDETTHNTTDASSGDNTSSRTLTRRGNIGVTTSQQMIQSTIDLWQWNFFEQVFADIDTILTISTY